jgi:hypothetical protein
LRKHLLEQLFSQFLLLSKHFNAFLPYGSGYKGAACHQPVRTLATMAFALGVGLVSGTQIAGEPAYADLREAYIHCAKIVLLGIGLSNFLRHQEANKWYIGYALFAVNHMRLFIELICS